MTSNPYSSPVVEDSEITRDESRHGCGTEFSWLFLAPILCTAAGFMWYIAAATIVEFVVMPNVAPYKYPYGGPAIFLCLPLSTFYGLLIGIALVTFGSRHSQLGCFVLLVAGIITTLITTYWWFQFENAAECSSKYVLFYPLFTLNILTVTAGIFLALRANHKQFRG